MKSKTSKKAWRPSSKFGLGLGIGTIVVAIAAISGFAYFQERKTENSKAAPAGFIYREGIKLKLNGADYKFNGHNNTRFFCGGRPSDAEMDAYFAALAPRSMTRTWIFRGNDLTYMDKVVATAKKYNQFLMVSLADEGGNCDPNFNDSFYTSGYNTWYADWMRQILPRYKDNPTVAVWELANEPTSNNIVNVATFFGNLAKQLAPNQLTTTGISMFYNNSSTFQAAHAPANIDIIQVHEYDQHVNISPWTTVCINAAKALNKPCVVGEWGIYASQGGNGGNYLFGNQNSPCLSWSARDARTRDKIPANMNVPEIAGMLAWSWFPGGEAAGTCELSYRQSYSFFRTINDYRSYPSGTGGSTTTPTTPPPAPTPTTPPPAPTVPGVGTYNNTSFTYSGAWQTSTGTAKYQNDDHYSSTTGATATFTFSGNQIKVSTSRAPHHGILGISIDNGAEVPVDLYAATRADQSLVWTSPTLSAGNHTIKFRVTGNKNAAASSTVVVVDKVEVANVSTSTPTTPTNPTPTAPSISAFSANPGSVTAGQSSTLSWAVSGATGCSITPEGPSNITATSWTTPVLTATGTRTYTLSCNNAGGSTSRTATVTVNAPQTPPAKPTLSATKTNVLAGEAILLSWSAGGATGCTLNPGSFTSSGSTGSRSVTVNGTTTYSVVCTNAAGSSTSDGVTVQVSANPTPANPTITSFVANPPNVTSGGKSVLSWTTNNAVGCTLSDSTLSSAGPSGSYTTPNLSASKAYTLTCKNSANATTDRAISVTVNNAPAPAATAPVSNPAPAASTEEKVTVPNTNRTVTNAVVSPTVSGETTLDPSNITDTAKVAAIKRVEYYNGESLIEAVTEAPYALDTTKLKNGTYTITERTYFNDGSVAERTQDLTVENTGAESVTTPEGNSKLLPIALGGASLILLAALAVYAIWRRKLPFMAAGRHTDAPTSVDIDLYGASSPAQPPVYRAPNPNDPTGGQVIRPTDPNAGSEFRDR